MSFLTWYAHKDEQCCRLAREATEPAVRASLREEAALWREIARDVPELRRPSLAASLVGVALASSVEAVPFVLDAEQVSWIGKRPPAESAFLRLTGIGSVPLLSGLRTYKAEGLTS